MITIDKDIPAPPVRSRNTDLHETLAAMEPGDSFVVARAASSISSSVQHYARKHGKKFVMRKVEGNGTRVWRVA